MNEKRKQLIWVGVLVALFVFADWFVSLGMPRKSIGFFFERHFRYEPALDRAARYYRALDQEMLEVDEQLLFDLLAENDERFRGTKFSDERHADNPFGRLLDPSFVRDDLAMTRIDIAELSPDEPRYLLNPLYERYLEHPWDDELLKALYCDQLDYDTRDFGYLRALERGDGGYWDTHFLLGLLFLEKNGCYDRNEIEKYKGRVIENILQAARKDQTFDDLYAERIVFLFWAGRRSDVRKEWIDRIVDTQTADDGWRDLEEEETNPHTTGLAALAIKYFLEEKQDQGFW